MKKIVFDFGAVLFAWQPRALLRRELPHRVSDEAQAAHWELQIFENYGGDWGEFDRGTVSVPELVQRISSRTGLEPAEVQTVVDAVPHALQPDPGTLALMHELGDAGHELYFLSNMPAPYASHLEASHDFIKRFRSGVFSCRVQHNKPEPAIYHLAEERFGAQAEELVLLDDNASNVQTARALGWNALRFANAAQAGAEMRQAGWMGG